MSDYCKLYNRIWNDADFCALDGDGQRAYMMLLSYPTRDNAGVIPITMRRWVKATRDMTSERLTMALRSLAAARFVVVDWDAEEVLIRSFIKNDETYRQPNLWDNSVKSALKVQSELIRRHLVAQILEAATTEAAMKWKPSTNETVEALVRTLPEGSTEGFAEAYEEGLPEGFSEGLPKGLPKPPGVGALRTRPNAPTPTPTKAPASAAAPEPADDLPAISATPGADLIRRIVPNNLPSAVLSMLRVHASALLREHDEADVAAAVELWVGKTGVGPAILPSLVADVIKSRNGATRNGSAHNGAPISTTDAKGLGWLQFGQERDARANQSIAALEA